MKEPKEDLKPSFCVISAGDRYNYGDVLYPLIIREYLKQEQNIIFNIYDFANFGIIQSNLESVGGIPTEPITNLYTRKYAENSIAVVAGGQIIGASIEVLFKFVEPNRIKLYYDMLKFYALGKAGYSRENTLIKKYKCKTACPYIISRKDLSRNCQIAYSNVGGRLPDNEEIISDVKNADFISLRDSDSMNRIHQHGIECSLAPDGAVLMSDLFPLSELEKRVSPKVKNMIEKLNGKEYISVQFSNRYYNENASTIDSFLNEFYDTHKNVSIVYVPIGYALLHDDLIALKKSKKNVKSALLEEKLTVFDIMYLIAKSSFFVGTSLHGLVTAMSFAVPYIALKKQEIDLKIENFVNTWGCEPFNHCMSIDKLNDCFKMDYQNELEASAKNQKQLARKNYEKIIEIIK